MWIKTHAYSLLRGHLIKLAMMVAFLFYIMPSNHHWLQGPGGQVGQLEMKMLSVQGSKALFNHPPDTVHLPPIEEQRNSHTALPKRTNWPISYSMLKSVVS